MKNKFYLFLFSCLLFSSNVSYTQRIKTDSEKIKIEKVMRQFRQFWEDKDMNILEHIMGNDVTMLNVDADGNEINIGWTVLKDSLKTILIDIDKTKITYKDPLIIIAPSGNTAWFSGIWDWDLLYAGQQSQLRNQRLTCVLEKRNGSWFIVKLHNAITCATPG